jgi:hypothetical protein
LELAKLLKIRSGSVKLITAQENGIPNLLKRKTDYLAERGGFEPPTPVLPV